MTLQEIDRSVLEKIQQLEKEVEEVKRYPELQARKNAARPANQTLKDATAANNQLFRAVKNTEDQSQKTVFKKRYEEYKKKLDGFKSDITALTKAGPKGSSAEDATQKKIYGEEGELSTAGGVMNAAVRAQDANLDLLRDIEREGNIIKQTGDAVVNQLAQDDEKLDQLNKDMDTLQANLDAAKGEVEWFARQMATDKCFLFLMAAVIMGLCVLVFWKIYAGRKSSSSAAATTAAPRTASGATPAPPPPTSTTIFAPLTTAITTALSTAPPVAPSTTVAATPKPPGSRQLLYHVASSLVHLASTLE